MLFAIPLTLVGKTFNPSKFVFVCALGWGTAAGAAAGANQFWGIAVARFFTGLCEVGPGHLICDRDMRTCFINADDIT